MVKSILNIFLILCCIGGYFWYQHDKEQKEIELKRQKEIEIKRQAEIVRTDRIERIKREIARVQDRAEQLNRDLNETQIKLSTELEKQANTENDLAETKKKKEELSSAVNNLNNEAKKFQDGQRNKPRATDTTDEIKKDITQLNAALAKGEDEIKKLDCHYECMKRESYDDKRKTSDGDNGVWNYRQGRYVWVCKTHNYAFSKNIQYWDYRNESARLANNVKEIRNKISVLNYEIERNKNIDKENKESTDKYLNEINLKISKIQAQQKIVTAEEFRLLGLKKDADRNVAICNIKINNTNNEFKSLKSRQLDLMRENESLAGAPQQ